MASSILVPTPEACWEPSNEKLPLLPGTTQDDSKDCEKAEVAGDQKGKIPENKSDLLFPDQWQSLPTSQDGPNPTEEELMAAEAASAELKRKEKQKHEDYKREQAAVDDLRSG